MGREGSVLVEQARKKCPLSRSQISLYQILLEELKLSRAGPLGVRRMGLVDQL